MKRPYTQNELALFFLSKGVRRPYVVARRFERYARREKDIFHNRHGGFHFISPASWRHVAGDWLKSNAHTVQKRAKQATFMTPFDVCVRQSP